MISHSPTLITGEAIGFHVVCFKMTFAHTLCLESQCTSTKCASIWPSLIVHLKHKHILSLAVFITYIYTCIYIYIHIKYTNMS